MSTEAELILTRLEGKFDAHLAANGELTKRLVELTDKHDLTLFGKPPENLGLDKRVSFLEKIHAAKAYVVKSAIYAGLLALGGWLAKFLESVTSAAAEHAQ